MYHRRASASSVPPPPSPFQRTRSVPTSGTSMFHESSTESPDQRSLSFSILEQDEGDGKYNRKTSGRLLSKDVFYWRILPCLVLMVLPWIPCQRRYWQIKSRRATINTLLKEQKDMVQQLDDVTGSIQDLKKEIDVLTKDNELSYQEIYRNGKGLVIDVESEEYEELEEEEEGLVNRIDRLETAIQEVSFQRLTEAYGGGAYRLRVGVIDEVGGKSYFIIETAMVMDMPHAIDHFMRMVEKRLWDGLALVHEPHSKVITATPMTMDDSHTWAGQRFTDANLTHMAFNEYSSVYPPPHHRKFSVAFSGRPGGPSFYINLEDEVDFSHQHESTFGVVLEGRDVLLKLALQMDKKTMLTIENIEVLSTRRPDEFGQTDDY